MTGDASFPYVCIKTTGLWFRVSGLCFELETLNSKLETSFKKGIPMSNQPKIVTALGKAEL
ncbi:MAG: hypothetical protein AAB154_06625, partial [Candidatus Binatota bacterium]